MTGDTFPRLCGGVFLKQLLQARAEPQAYRMHYRNQGVEDTHRQQDLFSSLIKIAVPDYSKPKRPSSQDRSFASITTRYIACIVSSSVYLPFIESEKIKDFESRYTDISIYKRLVADMQSFIDTFLDNGTRNTKSIRLVKKIIGLCIFDDSIKDADILYKTPDGEWLSKSTLSRLYKDDSSTLQVSLPHFLLGIWHFIVVYKTDNFIGKETVNRDDWDSYGTCKIEIVNQDDVVERKSCNKEAGTIDDTFGFQEYTKPELKPNRSLDEFNQYPREQAATQNNTPFDQVVEVFKQAISDYRIEYFLQSDLTKIYFNFRDFQHKVNGFIDTIQTFVLPRFTNQEVSVVTYHINQFCIALKEYCRYLKENDVSKDTRSFIEQAMIYKMRISSAYTNATKELTFWNLQYD